MTCARNDPSMDHALSLLLAEETEEALRWAAGIVERDPQAPAALMVTSQLLQQMGRTRAATDGLDLSFRRALTQGNLPLALAAIDGLRELGVDVHDLQRSAATTFSLGSSRVDAGANTAGPPPDELKPLSPFLAGPALASQATGILRTAREATEEGDPLLVAPLPLFSALSTEALTALLDAFHVMTVPAGYVLIKEGAHVPAVYLLAQGQVEIHRRTGRDKPSVPVSRMEDGAFFGEMALLGEVPAPYSVVATRPSIVLIADRRALEAVATLHPSISTQLDAHCRRRLLASLGRSADLLQSVPADRRANLVDRFEVRVFPRGATLMREGADVDGLYLIASGEVTVSAREGTETVVLASLGAGETVGDVELVLCRRAAAGAVAAAPTATLFLPRSCFESLVRADPVTAHGVYLNAVRKAAETARAMEAPTDAAESYVLDDELQVADEVQLADEVELPAEVQASAEVPMPAELVTADPFPPPTAAAMPIERPKAASSPPPMTDSAQPAPSSLAPTTDSRRPAALLPPSSPTPPWRQGAQSLVTMGAVSLALGVVLTVMVTRPDTRGAAAGTPPPSVGAVTEADQNESPSTTASPATSSSSSPPASAAPLAPARPSVAARAPSKAARIPPPEATTAPPPVPSPSSAAAASPSPKPSAAPAPARPNAATAAAGDDFGDRQ